MLDRMSRDWWIIALQGVAAVVFGVLALLWPGITLLALVFMYGAYTLLDGVLALTRGIRRTGGGGIDWWRLARGIVGIAAGVIAFIVPGITALALLVLIAVRAIIAGAIELVAAFRLREELQHEWLLALDGLLSIAFGAVLILFPGPGALAVVWLIGSFAIATGVIAILVAFRMRGRAGAQGTPAPQPSPLS